MRRCIVLAIVIVVAWLGFGAWGRATVRSGVERGHERQRRIPAGRRRGDPGRNGWPPASPSGRRPHLVAEPVVYNRGSSAGAGRDRCGRIRSPVGPARPPQAGRPGTRPSREPLQGQAVLVPGLVDLGQQMRGGWVKTGQRALHQRDNVSRSKPAGGPGGDGGERAVSHGTQRSLDSMLHRFLHRFTRRLE